MYPCLGIEAVQEECLEYLKHKTPSVNAETAKFLTRAFAKCPAPVFTNKKMVKGYVSCLVERLNHPGKGSFVNYRTQRGGGVSLTWPCHIVARTVEAGIMNVFGIPMVALHSVFQWH